MDIRISPHPLRGSVTVPASKSDAHRALILAALADRPTFVGCAETNRDIDATAGCLNALGASVSRVDGGFSVEPVSAVPDSCTLDCGESGSTLRFMLPVAASLGASARFVGAGRLGDRPLGPLVDALKAGGCSVSSDRLPLEISGRLAVGNYAFPGDISSQFITGMLMALARLGGGSVSLTSKLESAGYVDMTVRTLAKFGVSIERRGDTFNVSGTLRTPDALSVEGDWSAAAFYFEANALGGSVEIHGVDGDSAQPDRAAATLFSTLGGKVDVSGCPDLFPALALAACGAERPTEFVGGARLRLKESDRISATAAVIRAMGGDCAERPDGLLVTPATLVGGSVDGANDHRIVMAAAVAAAFAHGETVIHGAEAVDKSYPAFFDDFRSLGGVFDVL